VVVISFANPKQSSTWSMDLMNTVGYSSPPGPNVAGMPAGMPVSQPNTCIPSLPEQGKLVGAMIE